MPTHLVMRARVASRDLDLPFEKKVSALLPETAPDRPLLFPDWSRTTAIRNTHDSSWTTVKTMVRAFTRFNPFYQKTILYRLSARGAVDILT